MVTRRCFAMRAPWGALGLGLATARGFSQDVQRVDSNEISTDLITPDVKRVGVRLRCLCGCAMTVGECNMVGCHYASPARQRIHEMLKAGMSDDAIVADFVKREGIRALAAPPATGFNWFGYSAPYILGGVGVVVVAFVVKRLLKPPPSSTTPAAPAEPVEMDQYVKAAARDMEDLED